MTSPSSLPNRRRRRAVVVTIAVLWSGWAGGQEVLLAPVMKSEPHFAPHLTNMAVFPAFRKGAAGPVPVRARKTRRSRLNDFGTPKSANLDRRDGNRVAM